MNSPVRTNYFRTLLILLLAVPQLTGQDQPVIGNVPDLFRFLNKIENTEIQKIEIELSVRQPIDHDNPEKGYFNQRVFIIHKGMDRPVVMDTEGYQARPHAISELTPILNANQIHVEHRYFGESVPDSIDYTYLNIRQAAADHHRIIALFKQFYTGPWVTTGISKGGQTAMYHKRFYPNDVAATVCYVSPLNFSERDMRIDRFLKTVGTDSCRQKILDLQLFLLNHRDRFMPLFRDLSTERKYEFSIGDSVVWEYCVLEYPFAFWQWQNADYTAIPDTNSATAYIFDKFIKVSTPYYFSDAGRDYYAPFFAQAFSEIGYYGYDLEPFADKLKYVTDGSYRFCVPDNFPAKFDSSAMQDISKWIGEYGNNMIFIYGGNDPWGSTGVELSGNTNALIIVLPGGSHTTRIKHLSDSDRKLILNRLEEWLDVKIENSEIL